MTQVVGDNKPQLKDIVDRIERMMDEQDTIKEDIKEIYLEAKNLGFDVKIIRKVLARRKRDRQDVEEEDAMIDVYEKALEEVKKKVRKAGVEV